MYHQNTQSHSNHALYHTNHNNNSYFDNDNDEYDDKYEYDDDDEPLFSKTEIYLFSVIILVCGFCSYYVFQFFNKNFLKILYNNDYNEDLLALLSMKFSFVLITIIMLWIVYYRLTHYSYESLSSYLGFHKPNWRFLLLWATIFMLIHSVSWGENVREIHLKLSESIFNYGIWTTLLGTVLIAPICEELICRGFLWRASLDAFKSEKMAFIVSSSVFALAHYKLAMGAMIFYFIMSFIFIRARLVGGTLFFAIFLHFLHNFALVLETLVLLEK